MHDPYLIEGPASISFSGGRSSAYMLYQILCAHDGKLPTDVIVQFANTGKEEAATLDFVQECSTRWDVPIAWVEYCEAEVPADRWREVTYTTASRAGEPFEAAIRCKNYLPNPVTRFCTSELKIKAMARRIVTLYGWTSWTSVLGIRADEPRRLTKLSIPNRDRDERYAPMGAASVTASVVGEFWRAQPFNLMLPNHGGRTMHGNCDLCFLKGGDQIMSLIRERPDRAIWWARMETIGTSARDGGRFRYDRPSYAAMLRNVEQQTEMFEDEPLTDCLCGE